MKRILLKVAYDGTNYAGWQVQKNANTVAGEINKILSELLREEISVLGASRTDSGVHSMGNVAIFDTESSVDGDKFAYILNSQLPEDIRVLESKEVVESFHPHKCKSTKTYRYTIDNGPILLPTKRLYSSPVKQRLDVDAMKEAAKFLIGEHDFKSFCSINTTARTTIRRVIDIDVDRNEDTVTIDVMGEGFLYNMVRIIAGTLVEVGLRRRTIASVGDTLKAVDREEAGKTMPARGLCLMKIEY